MSANKSKIAIVGVGNIGKVVASNLVKGNRPVVVASRTLEDAQALAGHLGALATATDIRTAIQQSEVIILAVWFDSIKSLLKEYAADLQGKIVVDPSNPIAPDGNGGFKKIIGAEESAGEIILSQLPKNVKLAKAFGTLGAASLDSASHKTPAYVLFYATDDSSINVIVEELIKDSGFESVRVGGIDQSIKLEVFGQFHEFGALGKVITLAEIK
jgi:predicted dinucleotide-binding enzyme